MMWEEGININFRMFIHTISRIIIGKKRITPHVFSLHITLKTNKTALQFFFFLR
jgi:hypothetical protein